MVRNVDERTPTSDTVVARGTPDDWKPKDAGRPLLWISWGLLWVLAQ